MGVLCILCLSASQAFSEHRGSSGIMNDSETAEAENPSNTAAAQKIFYMLAIDPKGTAFLKKRPISSSVSMGDRGDKMKSVSMKSMKSRWEGSTFIWEPSKVVAKKGDHVILNFVGLSGLKHFGYIEYYHPKEFMVRAGFVTTLEFMADKAGRFKIGSNYEPSLAGELIVLD